MAIGGAVLRISQTLLRALQLCCALVACGVFAYYLAALSRSNSTIAAYIQAVAGMSGAAIIYTAFAVLLTLCFAGVAFLGYIAIILDICFVGCFAAIAYFTRRGTRGCSGVVDTPLGRGPANTDVNGSSLSRACNLQTAVFAVSIIAIFLFILTAILQFLLIRHHKKEKRYGPSPANNYTSGVGRRPFWKRNKNIHTTRDAEMATAPNGHQIGAIPPSDDTAYTGSTVGAGALPESKYGHSAYTNGPGFNQPAATGPNYGQPGYNYTHTTPGAATNY